MPAFAALLHVVQEAADDAVLCSHRGLLLWPETERGSAWREAWLAASGLEDPSADEDAEAQVAGMICPVSPSESDRPWRLPLRAGGRGIYMLVRRSFLASSIPQVLYAFAPHLFFSSSLVTYPSPTLSKRRPGIVVKGLGGSGEWERLRIPALDDVLTRKENIQSYGKG